MIVCADHGKTLGDYPRDEHPPHYLRDINLNVPLWIKRPGQREVSGSGSRSNSSRCSTSFATAIRRRGPTPARRRSPRTSSTPAERRPTRSPGGASPPTASTSTPETTRGGTPVRPVGRRQAVEPRSRSTRVVWGVTLKRVRRFGSERSDAADDGSATDREIDADVEAQLKDLGYM